MTFLKWHCWHLLTASSFGHLTIFNFSRDGRFDKPTTGTRLLQWIISRFFSAGNPCGKSNTTMSWKPSILNDSSFISSGISSSWLQRWNDKFISDKKLGRLFSSGHAQMETAQRWGKSSSLTQIHPSNSYISQSFRCSNAGNFPPLLSSDKEAVCPKVFSAYIFQMHRYLRDYRSPRASSMP